MGYGRCRAAWPTRAMPLDPPRQPPLHLRLHPPHGPCPDAHPARKALLGFELVDHRAPEAGDFADLRQAQDLYARRRGQ